MKIRLKTLRRMINEELQVAAEVKPSSIQGTGLYAVEFIPKGGLVFQWNRVFDRVYPKDYPDRLPPSARSQFKRLASWDGETWHLAAGAGAYFNHSANPNVRVVPGLGIPAEWDRIATRDIDPGEELTMDYTEIGID